MLHRIGCKQVSSPSSVNAYFTCTKILPVHCRLFRRLRPQRRATPHRASRLSPKCRRAAVGKLLNVYHCPPVYSQCQDSYVCYTPPCRAVSGKILRSARSGQHGAAWQPIWRSEGDTARCARNVRSFHHRGLSCRAPEGREATGTQVGEPALRHG